MNTIKLNTLGDKVIVRKAAENGGNEGGDNGGSGGGSASSVEYLDLSNVGIFEINALATAMLECKGISDRMSIVAPAVNVQPFIEALGITITQAKVDFNTPIVMIQGGAVVKQTALEKILSAGITQDQLDAIPRITEEEFYTL